jgi:heme-degrading monooxygenase HmoA
METPQTGLVTGVTNQEHDAQWTSDGVAAPPETPSRSTVVVATRFVVRRRRDTPKFLHAALASAREAEAVPGFLGGTVLADLWNKQFWTVSVWESPEAVRSYGSAPDHTRAMRRSREWAAESQVERWRTSTSEVPALTETARRFGVSAPRRGLVRRLRPKHPVSAPPKPMPPGPVRRASAGGTEIPPGQRHGSTNTQEPR